MPTFITLVLFTIFVFCWRRQSARKNVLTKLYDPHGLMRKKGISAQPPSPPMFFENQRLFRTMDVSGEDNAAYVMSRSPSAEAASCQQSQQVVGYYSINKQSQYFANTLQPLHLCTEQTDPTPMTTNEDGLQCQPPHMNTSDVVLTTFRDESTGETYPPDCHVHDRRMYSDVADATCESPVIVSGCRESVVEKRVMLERPPSQTSHSSHSMESVDSGFRSSRSVNFGQHDQPINVPNSMRCSTIDNNRRYDERIAKRSLENGTANCIQLTPTTLRILRMQPAKYTHLPQFNTFRPASKQIDTDLTNKQAEIGHIANNQDWKYLHDLAPGKHTMRYNLKETIENQIHYGMKSVPIPSPPSLTNVGHLDYSIV